MNILGKSQLYSIYISLDNIPIWHRNKLDVKQLLEYLPILKAADKNLVHEVFHKSLRHLLEPIISLKNGVDLFVNNENIWFYPRVLTIITDWPEAVSFYLVYKSFNLNLLYYFYLIKKNDLANTDLSSDDIILRIHNEMRKHLEGYT